MNAYSDVKLSLCSFSRNGQVERLSREEKRFVISKMLVFPLSALAFFLLSHLTHPAERDGKICSCFQTLFSLFVFFHTLKFELDWKFTNCVLIIFVFINRSCSFYSLNAKKKSRQSLRTSTSSLTENLTNKVVSFLKKKLVFHQTTLVAMVVFMDVNARAFFYIFF